MRNVMLATFLTVAMPAFAADLPPKAPRLAPAPVADWTGLYIGAHGGWATGEWDGNLETTAGCDGTCPSAGYANSHRTLSGDGWIGGGQIGFNYQTGRIVFGLEADISWTGIDASGAFDTDKYNPWVWSKKHDLSLDYFGTARLRLGMPVGRTLPYITGGLAWGKVSGDLAVTQSHEEGIPDGTSYASVNETHWGWSLGGGLEHAFHQNWSLKVEYLYVDLGEQTYLFKGKTFTGASFETDSFPASLNFHTVRAGINYRF